MTETRRTPIVATLLSLVVPGLGHVYVGRLVAGLALMVGHLALSSLLVLLAVAVLPSLGAVCAAAALWGVYWVGVAGWAYRCSLDTRRPLLRKEYQRPTVYVLLGLLALPNAAAWALGVRERVAELFAVPSRSMLPNIAPGSRILVDKLIYTRQPLRRGDLVVFVDPNARHRRCVKRVVALPGEVVAMENDRLVVNGRKLDYQSASSRSQEELLRTESNGAAHYAITLGPSDPTKPPVTSFPPQRVPNGHCFVLGDNRHHSEDSRVHGPVPLSDVIGRVERIF